MSAYKGVSIQDNNSIFSGEKKYSEAFWGVLYIHSSGFTIEHFYNR